ncbi:EMILIN-2 [Pseudophryne corroboree]|uniref:EMILIN-2 n=1 Tax=Pseudophryne corroboree TaxID=495146 RepID=UPI0030816F4F
MNPDLMRRPRQGPSLWTGLFVILGVSLMAEATPQLTYHRPAQRGKNWCAFIVNKNVSCTVMEGTESFIQPQYKCAWNQIHCQPTLAYKVNFRPRYVTSYKVVTELEWRCCPGFRGTDCKEGPSDKAKQTAVQTPRPSGEKKEKEPTGQKTLDAKRDLQELNEAQEKKIQTLEDEMLRLTQTVIDLQTSLSGVNENLKITVQEDASKFLNEWLNNLAPTASATGGKTEYYLPGFSGSIEKEDGLKDVISELTSAREELRNKTDQIDELTRKINSYEERLIEFEELSRGPTATMSSVNDHQIYLDDKLEAVRNEMLEGMDRKMADLKNSCEYKLMNVQQQCEDNENCLGVKELVLEKESELLKEVNKLRSEMHPNSPNSSSNCCRNNDYDTRLKNLEQKVEKIAEAHRALNIRLDNEVQLLNTNKPDQSWSDRYNELEFRINVTEKNAEEHCFYIEDTLRGLINNSVEDMSNLIDLKIQLLENSQTNKPDIPDPSSSLANIVLHDIDELKDAVQRLDNEFKSVLHGKDGYLSNTDVHHNNYQVLVETQLGNSLFLKSLTDTVNEKFEALQNKTLDMEALQIELGMVRFDLYKIEDNVVLLNDSLNSFKRQLGEVNSTVSNTQLGLSAKVDVVQKLYNTTSGASTNGKCCNNLQDKFDILRREVTTDKGKCTDNTQGIQTEISKVDTRVSKLEDVCGKLDTISGSLQRIKDGLNKHVTSLWNCIHSINGTIKSHSSDIYGLKNSVQVFQTQITKITTDLQDLATTQPGADTDPKQTPQVNIIPQLLPRATEKPPHHQDPQQPVFPQVPIVPSGPKRPAQPQEPQDPPKPVPPTSSGSIVIPLIPGRNGFILEHGQAGPPGRIVKFGSGRQQGVDGQQDMQLSKGFAGAPGYPKPATDTKDHITITAFSESKGATATTAQISFSAGFSEQLNSFEVGLIPFNNVLVNDGEHYNPVTGIFTAPIEGRYMITAVLTPEQEYYVEAVLSVSNFSVARLDTSGYRRELLEYHKPSSRRPVCSGVGTFNIILPLKAGDEVSIVLTGGKLANSDSDEMYSTFSGVLLYPYSSFR